MKTMKTIWLTLLLGLTLIAGVRTQKPPTAILGEWLSPNKDSRVLIYRQGAAYFGRITWGTGSSPKDEKNPDPDLRSRNVVGLVILQNFSYNGDGTWKEGTIYDPREGKTYDCKMTLKDANNLSIRGYVGVSLFGRSETWSRFN